MVKINYNNSNTTLSILLVLLHTFSVALIFSGVKYLSKNFNSTEVVFLYKLFLLIFITIWISFKRFKPLFTPHIKVLVIRGLLSSVASISFMYGLKYVNIVSATALLYLEQVVWILMGLLFFNERIAGFKLFAIVLSASGAAMVLLPQLAAKSDSYSFNYYYSFIMIAVVCWACNTGVIKKISTKIKNETQIFYNMVFATLLSGAIALFEWSDSQIPIPIEFKGIDPNLLSIGCIFYIIGVSAAYCMHSATFFLVLQRSELSWIIPYHYSRLIFVGIANFLFFHDNLTVFDLLGYILIIAGAMIIASSQYLQKKKILIPDLKVT